MKNKNTLSKTNFIECTIWVSVILAYVYRYICFSGIYGLTVFQSKLVFWALVILLIPLGTCITFAKRRNYLSVLVNVALPFEIYTIISTFRYIPQTHIVALLIISFLSALYFGLIVFQKIKSKKHVKQIVCSRMKFATLGVRTIVVILLLCVTTPICLKSAFGYELIGSDVDVSIEDSADDKWSLSNNIETVAMLDEDTWKTLSLSEKMNVLGTVKNVEMRYFGINHEVYLSADILNEGVLGSYIAEEHRIIINIEHLKSSDSKEVLQTLLHECRHVYDRMCVDLYNQIDDDYKNMLMFQIIADYKEEFDNYSDGSDNISEYYSQAVEKSARRYSALATFEYFEYIDEYLGKSNETKMEE